jgi:hypothetical protein
VHDVVVPLVDHDDFGRAEVGAEASRPPIGSGAEEREKVLGLFAGGRTCDAAKASAIGVALVEGAF